MIRFALRSSELFDKYLRWGGACFIDFASQILAPSSVYRRAISGVDA